MTLYGVSFEPIGKQPIVLLKTVDEDRFLPIWIGHPEAAAILMKLQGASPPRPMTHDLLSEVVTELKGEIVKEGLTVRAAERAAREGGARRRPRKAAAVDPALVDRVRTAAEGLTGMPTRVSAGALQIRFEDEKGLGELVEALETASARLVADRAA